MMMEHVDGFDWDRKEPTCCVPWDFVEGQVFTVLAFNSPIKGSSPTSPKPPLTYPGHIGYWLSYDTLENPERSHYSIIQYTNSPEHQFDGQDLKDGNLKLKFYLYGGTPTVDNILLVILSNLILLYLKHIVIGSVLLVLAAASLVFLFRSYHVKRRRLSKSLCSIPAMSPPEHEL